MGNFRYNHIHDEPIAKLNGAGIFRPVGIRRDGEKSGYRQWNTGKMKRLATIHSDTQHEYYLQVPAVAILESSPA
jgi:hypothetical protein